MGTDTKTLLKQVFARRIWADDEKDDFLDVVYWFRQIVALMMGLAWGIVPLYGALGLVSYVSVSSLVTFIYISQFHTANDEEFGGVQEILKEGFMTAFATFLVMWIVVHTGLHS